MLTLLLATGTGSAHAQQGGFSFGIVAQPDRIGPSEEILREGLEGTERERLAFVVVTGLKSSAEPCSDRLYAERKKMLEQSQHAIVISPGAGDWAECRREDGSTAAKERLARIREIFFVATTSAGNPKLSITRQSSSSKFRDYSENMRWQVGSVIFGTVNVPGNNNHYVGDAGRNSEFDDRLIANRAWMRSLLHAAKQKKARSIVLFIDGDPRLARSDRGTSEVRDGYREFRRHLHELSSQYAGRVLLVHQPAERGNNTGLSWRGKLGELVVAPGPGWTQVTVDARGAAFSISEGRR